MSKNKAQGYETVDSEGQLYVFRGNFGFLEKVKELTGRGVFDVVDSVAKGDPEDVRDVLCASLVKIAADDADEMEDEQKRKTIEEFITKHGFQECNILANHMFTRSMVGDIKKNQIDQHKTVTSLIDHLMTSRLKRFRNHVALWVYMAMISGICVWVNIKILETPI